MKVAQLCLTLWDPMDYTVHGILQARILEWGAFPFSGGSPTPGIKPRSPALKVDSLPAEPQGKPKNTRVGTLSLLQQIFLTQELIWGLLHCRWILYQLSYQGSPYSCNRPLFPLPFGGLPISNPLYHVPWPQRWAWDSAGLNLDLRLSEAMGSWGWITCWQGPEDAPQVLTAEELP